MVFICRFQSLYTYESNIILPFLFLALCKVCYDDVGCFSRIFFTCHHRHPESPAKIGTTFTLFTRSTAGDVGVGESMDRKIPSTITTSKFDARRGTKILIHGWKGSMEGYRWTGMRDALLLRVRRRQENIILIEVVM